jgi:hypothetical protein
MSLLVAYVAVNATASCVGRPTVQMLEQAFVMAVYSPVVTSS